MISERTKPDTIKLTVKNDFGSIRHCELQPDQGVFVGTSSNCGLQLSGKGLSGIHCRIGLESGKLWVQDWMSAEGTRVNGESISTKSEVQRGDVIQIGTHQIAVASGQPIAEATANESAENLDRSPQRSAVDDEPVPATGDSACSTLSQDEAEGDDEALQHVSIALELEVDEPASIGFDNEMFEFEEEETYDRETVALLRAEIEELQSALAQRDAEQACDRSVSQLPSSPENLGAEHSDEVLARMQELIDEANRSDERVAILDEMLHASEEANRSEHEERDQLEAWVGDIEKRVSQREHEHAAELDALRQRLEESSLQRERLQKQLRQAACNGGAPKHYEETLENLQKQNEKLQEKLAESEKRRTALEQRLEQASGEQDRSLREERANIAKEQARISRLRFELSSKLAAIEEMPKVVNQADRETAQRIQTLREHLREIHEQEKQEEREASITTRLAKLWKRVEY